MKKQSFSIAVSYRNVIEMLSFSQTNAYKIQYIQLFTDGEEVIL